MKAFFALAFAALALAAPVEERAATTPTTTSTSSTSSATPTKTPVSYGNYGNYGKYGSYGSYGAYSRSAEAEADIEALLELARSIKEKREAEAAPAAEE